MLIPRMSEFQANVKTSVLQYKFYFFLSYQQIVQLTSKKMTKFHCYVFALVLVVAYSSTFKTDLITTTGLTSSLLPPACSLYEYLTPSGCWTSCKDPKFSSCQDVFPALYYPSFCAYRRDGSYFSQTYACLGCKNTQTLAIKEGACSCSFVKCPLNKKCLDGQCIDIISKDTLCATVKCSKRFTCKKGQCVLTSPGCNPACPLGTSCNSGVCTSTIINKCLNVKCQLGYICNNGKCIKDLIEVNPCHMIKCYPGSECKNGMCVPITLDPCAALNCPFGSNCLKGKCVQDLSQLCWAIKCAAGYTCENGKCISIDLCATIKCASGYICQEGKCIQAIKPPVCYGNCFIDQVCKNGKCLSKYDTCLNLECLPGLICIKGKCIKSQSPQTIDLTSGEYTTSISNISNLIITINGSQLSISGGCNNHIGQYTANTNDLWSLGTVRSTKKMCLLDLDFLYLDAFKNAVTYETVGNQVVFRNSLCQITIILTLSKVSQPVTFKSGSYSTDITLTPTIRVKFNSPNSISISGGCNIFTSSYSAFKNNTVNFTPFAGTRMFCHQQDKDSVYTNALSEAFNFVIDSAGQIQFFKPCNTLLITLTPESNQTQPKVISSLIGNFTTNILSNPDVTISFDKKRVSLQNGCNGQSAQYSVDYVKKTIKFEFFMSTMRFCENDTDYLYSGAFSESVSFEIQGGQITFRNKDIRNTIILSPVIASV